MLMMESSKTDLTWPYIGRQARTMKTSACHKCALIMISSRQNINSSTWCTLVSLLLSLSKCTLWTPCTWISATKELHSFFGLTKRLSIQSLERCFLIPLMWKRWRMSKLWEISIEHINLRPMIADLVVLKSKKEAISFSYQIGCSLWFVSQRQSPASSD